MKRRINQVFSLMLLLCLSNAIFAQTADEIIAKHIKAHGGEKKWAKVESLKITGKFTAFSVEEDFYTYKTKAGNYYSDRYLGQHKILEVFSGESGWTIDPWQGISYARNLNSAEVNVFYQKSDLFTPFYKYKEKGLKVEYTGKENVEGADMFVLKLTRKNGGQETWYLDAKTYLEFKCESNWVDFAYPSQCETYFEDFQKVDGLVLPFYVERTFGQRNRVTIIENVDVNPQIDKAIFEMPRRKEMKKLAFLEGDWDVQIAVMTRRGTWYPLGNTTSNIEYGATNMLEENISYEMNFPVNMKINYIYSESTGKYRLSVFNDLESSINILEGESIDTAMVVDDLNVSYGQNVPSTGNVQLSFNNIQKDGFTVLRKISRDKGKTWMPRGKLIYTRKK